MDKDKINKTDENVNLNPNMNVQGMGAVEFPGDPSSANDFESQRSGNSPISKTKKAHLLSYSDFLDLLKVKK